ncbi:MAG: DUF4143 domain-containing protein [Candidatus Eisenbacteria bacterium]|nr:DUF4143 domain-containing protein [Candidatus Eisenbacteria bacterium]
MDPGVVPAAKRRLGPVSQEEAGALLEGYVLAMLRTHGEQARIFEEVSFWSPHQSSVEVDFLLRRGREFVAIEVKAAARYSRSAPRFAKLDRLPGGATGETDACCPRVPAHPARGSSAPPQPGASHR